MILPRLAHRPHFSHRLGYAARIMRLDDLQSDEKLALGGLLRLMIRSDGDFTEKEEEAVNRAGERLGAEAGLWRLISQSAQDCPEDADIRAAVAKVVRPEARSLIRSAAKEVAEGDSLADSERELLAWLDSAWG